MSDEPIQAALARLQEAVDRLAHGQEALRAEVRVNLADARAAIMARVDRLQDQLTQTIEAGNVSLGLVASISNDARASRDSADATRGLLTTVQQQVQRLNARVAALENKTE